MSFQTDYVGALGEDIVVDYLKEKGFKVAFTGDRYKAHEIDLIIDDGKEIYYADVKTKRRREKYEDTGFDSPDVINYTKLSKATQKKVYIFFVDYYLGKVFGNYLHILNEHDDKFDDDGNFISHYPINYNKVTYFPLEKMEDWFKLKDEEIELIKSYSKEYEEREY